MLINDVKKGMSIRLTQGRWGMMADNKKGNIRMVQVANGMNGPEIGSVYVRDITEVRIEEQDGRQRWERVELSDRQKAGAARITAFGF